MALLCGFSAATVSYQSHRPAKEQEDKTLQEVVVTGSRIVRAGYDTLEPASVVTGEYIESRGLTNIADALNESPGFGTGTTPEGGQSTFGPGLNFVNRFDLGSNRTLTLINGRRFVSSNAPNIFGPAAPGNQVDLNFIPTVLVDHIDNLAVGGAPTYGADAIAGVVNVNLKKDFEGFRAFGQYGQLEDGGLQSDSVGLVGGWNFAGDRGNVTASIQHSRLDGLLATENKRFADAYLFATNPTRRAPPAGTAHAARAHARQRWPRESACRSTPEQCRRHSECRTDPRPAHLWPEFRRRRIADRRQQHWPMAGCAASAPPHHCLQFARRQSRALQPGHQFRYHRCVRR